MINIHASSNFDTEIILNPFPCLQSKNGQKLKLLLEQII